MKAATKAATKARKRATPRPRSRRTSDPAPVLHLPTGAVSMVHQDGISWREAEARVDLPPDFTPDASKGERETHNVKVRLRFAQGNRFDDSDNVKLRMKITNKSLRRPLDGEPHSFGLQWFDRSGVRPAVLIEGTAAEIRALHAALSAALLRAEMPLGRREVTVGAE